MAPQGSICHHQEQVHAYRLDERGRWRASQLIECPRWEIATKVLGHRVAMSSTR